MGRVGRNLDLLFTKVLNYCSCFVGTGVVVANEYIVGTGGRTPIFYLLDNFE